MSTTPIYIPTFISSVDFKPAKVLPRIYFYNGTKNSLPYYIEGREGSNVGSIQFTEFPYFDHYSGSTPDASSKSLLFNNEATPYGETPTESLYTEYWESYVQLLYNPKTRLLNCSAIIPLSEYFNLELNDIVNFRGNYYHLRAINDYNLSTGECTLQLLGPVISDTLNQKVQFNGIITDGLQLYLDAGNTNSYPGTGTTWFNLAAGTPTGSLIDGPTFSTEYGGSLVFDGVDDYVNISRFPNLNFSPSSSFSMTVWAKVDSMSTNRTAVVLGRGSTGGSYGIGMTRSSGGAYTWNVGSRAVVNTATSIPYTVGDIDNITLVYTPTFQYVYKNGVLEGTNNTVSGVSGSFDAASYQIMFASAVPSGTAGWPAGSVYSALIYNRALTDAEVAYNYNISKVRFGL